MKAKISAFCLLLSCTRYDAVMKEDCEADVEQRQWVLTCIANGNPMSDEEGEDLVEQCEMTSRRLFKNLCTRRTACVRDGIAEVDMNYCVQHGLVLQ